MRRAPPGLRSKPEAAPMMTPPDKVAFSKNSMLNLLFRKAAVIYVAKQLPTNATMVFEIICVLVKGVVAKTPKLNEGQYIQRNKVPIKAKIFEL
jgi:hypothetical protein